MAEEKEAPEKKEAKAEKPKAPARPNGPKQAHKKVTKMSLEEVEKAMEGVQKHMGGFHSGFGQALLARKAALTRVRAPVQRKAA